MSKQRRRVVTRSLKPLTLPELEQSKAGVLNSLGSLSSSSVLLKSGAFAVLKVQ
jgi:hypothetical protein